MRGKHLFLCILCTTLFTGSRIADPANESRNWYSPNDPSTTQTIATGIYHEFLSAHKVLTDADNPEVETLNRISNRVIAAVKKYYEDRKNNKILEGFDWQVNMVEETKRDAWCLPGGKIVVYSSLIPITQSDASLAVVLSHEIAHLILKHGETRMKQYVKDFLDSKDLAAALSAKPRETKDFFRMAYGTGDYVGVIRGFSVDDEIEADKLGVIFCAMAGYNPEDAIVLWERMERLRGTGRHPEWVLTHPVSEKRIDRLREIMEDILKKYYKPISKN